MGPWTLELRATTRAAIPGTYNGGHNTHGGRRGVCLFFFLSNPRLTVAMPIPEDPSLPIRAVMTKEMQQGLYIYLPSLPEEESPPQDQWLPPGFAWTRGPLDP